MEMRFFVDSDKDISESVGYAMSIPGVGWIVATYAIARIGDWRELGDSNEMASFFGLVQTEDSTGDRSDRGSITKAFFIMKVTIEPTIRTRVNTIMKPMKLATSRFFICLKKRLPTSL